MPLSAVALTLLLTVLTAVAACCMEVRCAPLAATALKDLHILYRVLLAASRVRAALKCATPVQQVLSHY
jgi:hypothetical protein